MPKKLLFLCITTLILSTIFCKKEVLTDELARKYIVGEWKLNLADLSISFQNEKTTCFKGLFSGCFEYQINKEKITLTRKDASQEIAYKGFVIFQKNQKTLDIPIRKLTKKDFSTKLGGFPLSFSKS